MGCLVAHSHKLIYWSVQLCCAFHSNLRQPCREDHGSHSLSPSDSSILNHPWHVSCAIWKTVIKSSRTVWLWPKPHKWGGKTLTLANRRWFPTCPPVCVQLVAMCVRCNCSLLFDDYFIVFKAPLSVSSASVTWYIFSCVQDVWFLWTRWLCNSQRQRLHKRPLLSDQPRRRWPVC